MLSNGTSYPHSSIISSLAISTKDLFLSIIPAQSSIVSPKLGGYLTVSIVLPFLSSSGTELKYTPKKEIV